MLADRVGAIPGTVGAWWNRIPATCHFATIYWLFSEITGRAPTEDDYMDMGNPQVIIRKLLPFGRKLKRPGKGHILLTSGTVIVFTEGGDALHSCIVTDGNKLSGYNQADWYSSDGVVNGFSSHSTADIKWRSGVFHKKEVLGNSGQTCNLIAIDEDLAKQQFKSLVNSV